MVRSAIVRFVVTFGMLVLLVGTTAPLAFAKSGPPQLTPEARKHLHVTPNSFYCDPGYIYDNVVDKGDQIAVVAPYVGGPYTADQPNNGPAYRSYNGTSSNATATFTATVQGSVNVAVNTSATVDTSVIVAGVNATLGITVTTSIQTSIGHGINITVPPHQAGYGQYGVYRKVTDGHYYNLQSDCQTGVDDGTVRADSPWYPNWNTWTGA